MVKSGRSDGDIGEDHYDDGCCFYMMTNNITGLPMSRVLLLALDVDASRTWEPLAINNNSNTNYNYYLERNP